MAEVLGQIGYADALVVREIAGKYEILDGHLRAETTPDQDVPCLVVDLDEDFSGDRRMKRAFTLVELLVVVTIIAMLAAVGIGALRHGQEQGRIAVTRATILKIDRVVRELWDGYPPRRVPVGRFNLVTRQARMDVPEFKRWLLNCRRDLLRMEMPDRWSDIAGPPLFLPEFDDWGKPIYYGHQDTRRQQLLLAERQVGRTALDAYESCECLYMVVRSARGDKVKFVSREVGDVDHDGLNEFLDGWGRPICWHRWPAGWALRPGAEWRQEEPISGSPMFDTLGPYPLVFSAGPDGVFDVNRGIEYNPATGDAATYRYGPDYAGNLNPWTDDEQNPPRKIGEPVDAMDLVGNPPNGHLDHHDNITNYSMARRR